MEGGFWTAEGGIYVGLGVIVERRDCVDGSLFELADSFIVLTCLYPIR